jgi:cellulose synthase/poly-beta-1,6-N-acetylglucosamine synthase-like glycosyltransferase
MVHKSLDQILFEATWIVDGATSRRFPGPQSWDKPARTREIPEAILESYRRASAVTGPLTIPQRENDPVQFKRVASHTEERQLLLIRSLSAVANLFFLVILFWPGHYPDVHDGSFIGALVACIGYALVVTLESARILQSFVLSKFARNMYDPVPLIPQTDLRVAVLTTIVPEKEPIELVARTLEAMTHLTYPGTVDVWILDEGNDPEVRRIAESLDVHHFSRRDRPEYNQPNGQFRARSKAGNHNAWRDAHEDTYQVVAQMDPDHVPLPEFLMRTLGYFRDPDVGFVVAPQVYANQHESFVAHGAAEQAHVFHGAIQRGANRWNVPVLIGTNHLYRTATWKQIGGYQDSVIEDHLTSMRVHATINPATGKYWKGVYTPDIISIGEGPRSWTDYFNQQYRWSYGILEILLRHSPRLLRQMPLRRALSYLCLQTYYPSVGYCWWVSPVITALYLVFGLSVIRVDAVPWLLGWVPSVLLAFYLFVNLRRFNLVTHEQRGCGIIGILLTIACGATYAWATLNAALGRPCTYVVTAKADRASQDTFRTFRHAWFWVLAGLALVVAGLTLHHSHWALDFWALFLVVAAGSPILGFAWKKARRRR